ncbi:MULTISPECIES: phosphoribosyltransferase [unclassified Caballeronia]|uniref:phosphoribosyltransferase n=1 Tax=unclassified Caballeronia TaxID=2646786 RepID=UPI00285B1C57|nr:MULTISPECIES: phosphoribosyltransferase [unclassified Caballeronia]MDR5753969.1 phosphoribosyltransferase [Caballeronia sp. LZ024]MDR5840348.1 phosphoribosyltransferase [Caballeronia sp. LZ031]
MESVYENRAEAGRVLAGLLAGYAHRDDVLVLGLPRGGVPVAFEVARALDADLDVLVVRKLGVPVQPELAMGAIASGGAFYLDDSIVRYAGVSPAELDAVIASERIELARRERAYRGNRGPVDVEGRIAIVVDDGMATGATMKAAAMALRERKPARVVAALPVAPANSESRVETVVDEFVCAMRPRSYFGVGQFYLDFSQTSDEEVFDLLREARRDSEARRLKKPWR